MSSLFGFKNWTVEIHINGEKKSRWNTVIWNLHKTFITCLQNGRYYFAQESNINLLITCIKLQLNEININTLLSLSLACTQHMQRLSFKAKSNEQFFLSDSKHTHTFLDLLTARNQYYRLSCPNTSYFVVFFFRFPHTCKHTHSPSLSIACLFACALVW